MSTIDLTPIYETFRTRMLTYNDGTTTLQTLLGGAHVYADDPPENQAGMTKYVVQRLINVRTLDYGEFTLGDNEIIVYSRPRSTAALNRQMAAIIMKALKRTVLDASDATGLLRTVRTRFDSLPAGSTEQDSTLRQTRVMVEWRAWPKFLSSAPA